MDDDTHTRRVKSERKGSKPGGSGVFDRLPSESPWEGNSPGSPDLTALRSGAFRRTGARAPSGWSAAGCDSVGYCFDAPASEPSVDQSSVVALCRVYSLYKAQRVEPAFGVPKKPGAKIARSDLNDFVLNQFLSS